MVPVLHGPHVQPIPELCADFGVFAVCFESKPNKPNSGYVSGNKTIMLMQFFKSNIRGHFYSI